MIRMLIWLGLVLCPAAHAGEPALNANDLADYQQQIEQLESEHGPLAGQLAEPLTATGLIYLQQNRLTEAAEVFRRALHIRRTTEGLHNIKQADLVELLIQTNTALHDFEGLDQNYQYLHWLYARELGEDNPALVPVIERIARWRFHQFITGLHPEPFMQLLEAERLYTAISAILEPLVDQGGIEDRHRLLHAYYQRAAINFHLIEAANSLRAPFNALRKALSANGRTVFHVNQQRARQKVTDEAFFEGQRNAKRAIRLAGRFRDTDPLTYAETLAFHGDWYLATKRQYNAMKKYREAFAFLTAAGVAQAEIDTLFGTPRPVKPLTAPGDEAADGDTLLPHVDAVFDVQDSGWPRNIRIVKTEPGNDPGLIQRGRRAIAGVRYRPRIENGKPVAARDVTLTYAFKREDSGWFFWQ